MYIHYVPSITLSAPAKVNLGLEVGARRTDGYHELQTILVRISLADRIRLTRPAQSISLSINGPGAALLPADAKNLAWRAAECYLAAAGVPEGVRIALHKEIPIGAGLGGGSSDAAAVLMGLNRLWGNRLGHDQLIELAGHLGSDVPFFLYPEACLATGRGELLQPVRLPSLRLLLHIPAFAISTGWAYQELDRWRARPQNQKAELTARGFSPNIVLTRIAQGTLEGIGSYLHNTFEPLIFSRHPELHRIRELMLASGAAAALLSGSGSALFAVVSGQGQKAVERALRQAQVDYLKATTIR